MSNIAIPYRKIQIPTQGDVPAKTIYVPVLKTTLYYKNNEWLFDFDSIVDSGADFCVFPAKMGKVLD